MELSATISLGQSIATSEPNKLCLHLLGSEDLLFPDQGSVTILGRVDATHKTIKSDEQATLTARTQDMQQTQYQPTD